MGSAVFKYGLLPPVLRADEVAEQMRLAHAYQNKLIELERSRREARDAVLLKVPEIATIASRLQSLEEALSAARGEIAAARSAARTTNAGDPTPAKNIGAELKALRKRRKEAVAEALKRAEVIEEMNAVAESHKAAVKAARAANGVYWGTYGQVERSVEQSAKSPKPPAFRRWAGDGAVGVQLIASQGEEARKQSVDGVISGENTFVRINPVPQPVPGRGQKGSRMLPRLMIRIGSEGREPIFAEWPIILHRPFPPGALVKFVKVLRQRVGAHDRWSAHFTLSFESQTEVAGEALAVNLRWTKRLMDGERTTLAADWTSEKDPAAGEVFVAPEVMSQLRKADDLRSIRDKNFERAKASLGERLKALTLSDEMKERVAHLHAWKAQGKLAGLAIWWRTQRFAGDTEAFDLLEAWRKQDKHLWDWEANARRKALARRKDDYRVFASRMARVHKVLVIERLNLARLAAEPAPEEDRDFNSAASAQRFATAPSELRSALVNAFRRDGGKIVEVSAGLTSKEMLAAFRASGGDVQAATTGRSARTQRLLRGKKAPQASSLPG